MGRQWSWHRRPTLAWVQEGTLLRGELAPLWQRAVRRVVALSPAATTTAKRHDARSSAHLRRPAPLVLQPSGRRPVLEHRDCTRGGGVFRLRGLLVQLAAG